MAINAEDYLASHKRWHEEKISAEIRQQEEFYARCEKQQKLDGAWNLLDTAVQHWYLERTDEHKKQLTAAIKLVAVEIRNLKREGDVRQATKRCQDLSAIDPTGKTCNLYDISDRAAALTILESALENSRSVSSLVGDLRLQTPLVGSRVRDEVEWNDLSFPKEKECDATGNNKNASR